MSIEKLFFTSSLNVEEINNKQIVMIKEKLKLNIHKF